MKEAENLKLIKLSEKSHTPAGSISTFAVIALCIYGLFYLQGSKQASLLALTPTASHLYMAVPKPTATPSNTPTFTPSATFTATPTSTNTPTVTPSYTLTNTPMPTPTETASNTPTLTATVIPVLLMAQYNPPTATMQPGANLEPSSGNTWQWQRVVLFLSLACFAIFGLGCTILYRNYQEQTKIVTVTTSLPHQRDMSRVNVGTPTVRGQRIKYVQPSQSNVGLPTQMIINVNTPPAPQEGMPIATSEDITRVNSVELGQVQPIQSIESVNRESIQTHSTAVFHVIHGELLGIGRGTVQRFDGREFVVPFDENRELSEHDKRFIIAYYQSMPQGKRNLNGLCWFIYGRGGGGGTAYNKIKTVYDEWMKTQVKE